MAQSILVQGELFLVAGWLYANLRVDCAAPLTRCQIGSRFWDAVLTEHAGHNKNQAYDEPLATFFRNVDTRHKSQRNVPTGDGTSKIVGLRARGLMIDMEEGVLHEFNNSRLGELFDPHQIISDTSGSGNNWAVGYHTYGPQHREHIIDAVRKEAESCDALQSFFIVHSLGGGTGSGLGSYITELFAEEFDDVYRFNTVIIPSKDDDVVTSPYNSMLALHKLTDYSDCVLPIENGALFDICDRIKSKPPSTAPRAHSASMVSSRVFAGLSLGTAAPNRSDLRKPGTSIIDNTGQKKQKPFDAMNNIVANLLLNFTSSMRFEGSLNVDINEITMNLIPFPRLKYLLSSMTPLYTLADVGMMERSLDQMFLDAFSRDNQLIRADPKSSVYLACALIVRGGVEISDIRRNISRVKSQLQFAWWNQDGWKTGLCKVAPVNQPYSLLTLANNCCIRSPFIELRSRFSKLFSRKANVHHYTQHMELSDFRDADTSLRELTDEYSHMERNEAPIVEDWESWARSQGTV